MNTEELNQKIANMEAELASMKALVNKLKPVINYWQPTLNERFWFIHHTNQTHTVLNYCPEDNKYRIFKTKEEAQKYAEYIKAEETLRKAIAEANEGWLPNWSPDSSKFVVGIVQRTGYLKVLQYNEDKLFPNFMYIKSGTIASNLLRLYEKEFKTYLLY